MPTPLDPSLKSWALPRLSTLLAGLDDASLTQLLEYTCSLDADAGAEHLRNILGDSARALEFIVGFGERWRRSGGGGGKMGEMAGGTQQQQQQRRRRQEGRKPPSASGPLISEYLPNVRSKAARASVAKRQQQQQGQSSSSPSRNRPSPSTSTSTKSTTTTTTTTTSNIADLTAAIAQLELTTNPSVSTTTTTSSSSSSSPKPRKKCNCQATLHPLFTPAPNCINCGKIICALEGLQPCSFCQQPLLSAGQVQEMIRELRAERGSEKMRAHNNGKGAQRGELYDETPVDSSSSNNNSGGGGAVDGTTSSSSETTTHRDLAAAKAHRDKLLHFQAQNARRTKVVDEVAEFETPDVHAASTLWMSAGQRALALKRQQKVMREMEERGKEEWERRGGSVVVSLSFEGGGRGKRGGQRGVLRRVEERVEEREEEAEEEEVLEEEEEERKGGFGDNPLLAGGGLVRPVWKAKGADGDQSASRGERRQRQTWRRVQDDDEDNERWILDGGLYGYGQERREIEGGE